MCTLISSLEAFFDSFSPSLSAGLRENRLERMERLLSHMGNPERSFRSIHVAGSKGKGTLSSFLSSLLAQGGTSCGLYMSPHVHDIRERFTLATRFFSDELYRETLSELSGYVSSFTLPPGLGPIKPTTFELYTAYAYLLFRNAGVEYAVIETGLGGRLDATNTIDPVACCFTPIELEHTRILGNTLEEIASEKAGIMRPGIPVFSTRQKEKVMEVLEREASERGASSFTADIPIRTPLHYGVTVDERDGATDAEREDLSLALLTLSSLGLLRKRHYTFSSPSTFSLPGRFEKRNVVVPGYGEKQIIMDGAHTALSSSIFASALHRELGDKRCVLVFTVAEDKDETAVAAPLLPLASSVVVTSPGEWKKSDPERIRGNLLGIASCPVYLEKDTGKALEMALELSGLDGTVAVAGSFYLVAESARRLREMENGC